jgi:hypothetical protein
MDKHDRCHRFSSWLIICRQHPPREWQPQLKRAAAPIHPELASSVGADGTSLVFISAHAIVVRGFAQLTPTTGAAATSREGRVEHLLDFEQSPCLV